MGVPRQRTGPLATRVYAMLLDDIAQRRRNAGTRLVEAEIARDLDVSRTPVREALRRLKAEGLIEDARPGGFTLIAPSIVDVREIFEIRRALEPLAFARVVDLADGTGDDGFRAAFARLERAEGVDAAVAANIGFRDYWMTRNPNARMRETLERFGMQVHLVRHVTLNTADARQSARDGARELLETYLARDPARAEDAMRRFVDCAYRYFARAGEAGQLYPARTENGPEQDR